MEDFTVNFNIYEEYETYERWSQFPEKKRKRVSSTDENRKRHKDLDEEDINKIEENRHEINTKLTTAWAIGVFKDWLVEKGMSADIENYNADTLNQTLR